MSTGLLIESKHSLRRRMRHRRGRLSPSDQLAAAFALQCRLLSMPSLRAGGLLLGTLPHRGEIDSRPFLLHWLASGQPVALPRIDAETGEIELRTVNTLDQTLPGFRDILEPNPSTTVQVSPRSVTFLLIPGLAFDFWGTRLGQGGGHYDRLLERVPDSALRIGIAHDFQILPRIPRIPGLDHPMDFVVSPVRILHCPRTAGTLAPC
jgi:5-formyltetrahydrofolate cyclo-ligase